MSISVIVTKEKCLPNHQSSLAMHRKLSGNSSLNQDHTELANSPRYTKNSLFFLGNQVDVGNNLVNLLIYKLRTDYNIPILQVLQ